MALHHNSSILQMTSGLPFKISRLLLMIATTGCASLGGNTQYVSIDTDPRGVQLFLEGESAPIGTSPLLYKLQRTPSETISARFGDQSFRKYELNCHYRWTLELLGNGWMALVAPPAALAGFVTDYLTGAAFDCGTNVHIRSPNVDTPVGNYCQRFAISTPFDRDHVASMRMRSEWEESNKKFLGACDEFLPDSSTSKAFSILGIGSEGHRKIEDVGRERLYDALSSSGATSVIFLQRVNQAGQTVVRAEEFDIHKFTYFSETRFEDVPQQNSIAQPISARDIFSWSVSFVPNSVTYGFQSDDLKFHPTGVHTIVSYKEDRTNVPAVLSKFSLTQVEHPSGYDTWDHAVSLYPSLHLLSRRTRVEITDGTNSERMHMRGLYLSPMYNLRGTVHTAMGALSLYAGVGLFGGYQSENDHSDTEFGIAGLSGFEYWFFVTESVYFRTGFWSFKMNLPEHPHRKLELGEHVNGVEAGIGIFLPEMRRFLATIF
jgi:hypothetical protein